jgi:small subunit ribosomal protein S20
VAHSLSAKKRIRQNLKRRLRNRSRVRSTRTQIKHFEQTVKSGASAEAIEKEYRLTQQKIDKLAAKGSMHKNTAARRKAKLARQSKTVKSATKAS